jgi:hypothetical protein
MSLNPQSLNLALAAVLSMALISDASPGRAGALEQSPPTHSARHVRSISVFGVRLGMRLEDAREALASRGFQRIQLRYVPPTRHEAQVLEAEYRHPTQNTHVGLSYAELPNGQKRIGRIIFWEQIPVMDSSSFERFLTDRYGAPALSVFQGSNMYVWSQQPSGWAELLPSVQCMMQCIPEHLAGQCNAGTISRQVIMSGAFNTNMPGQLYWTGELDDLELQRAALFPRGSFPRRPICYYETSQGIR